MTERKDDRFWGGRFERAPNVAFDTFQRSFAFDRRLLPYELAVDRAWARALRRLGILTADEVQKTLAALDQHRGARRKAIQRGSMLRRRGRRASFRRKGRWWKNWARSAGSCTPAAAATNSSRRISALFVMEAAARLKAAARRIDCARLLAQAKANLGICPWPA